MVPPVRRRDLLVALGLTPVVGAGAQARAAAREPRGAFEPTIRMHPVTEDRAAVAVDAGSRREATRLVVTDGDAVVARGELTESGKAVLPLRVPRHGRRTVTVRLTLGGSTVLSRPLTLSTEPEDLTASLWRVVNKGTSPLAADEEPHRLVTIVDGVEIDPRAAEGMTALLTEAAVEKIQIVPSNAFRSYSWQRNLYDGYVARDGQAEADRYSARPGHSEHQTGLAVDLKAADGTCDLEECFGDTPEGKFVAKTATRAGFLVRYTEANEKVTGYQPEPWHLRYVGPLLTAYLAEEKITSLEEAFGLKPALTYGAHR